MQMTRSRIILWAICCLIGVRLALPVKGSERGRPALVGLKLPDTVLLPQPLIQIYWLGLPMSSACKNDSQWLSKLGCRQPIEYGYETTRCSGTFGAIGCQMDTSGAVESGGCVHRYHWEWCDQAKGTIGCMPTIYKR